MIKYIKLTTKHPLTGVEIGVYKGENALNILENLNIKMLYLVDPYIPFSSSGKNAKMESQILHTSYMESMLESMKPHTDRINFIRKLFIPQDAPEGPINSS